MNLIVNFELFGIIKTIGKILKKLKIIEFVPKLPKYYNIIFRSGWKYETNNGM